MNRLLGRPLRVIPVDLFESRVAPSEQGAGGNYEFELLIRNMQAEGMRLFAMTPEDLEGSAGRQSLVPCARLEEPWLDHIVEAGTFLTAGYLMRVPSYGGHWIAVLPIQDSSAGSLLADSMQVRPYMIARDELQLLFLATALAAVDAIDAVDWSDDVQWACFLIGVLK